MKYRSVLDAQGKAQHAALPSRISSPTPTPAPSLAPVLARSRILSKGLGAAEVAVAAAAAAAVVATVAASVVVAAVALLFLPKGHVACGSSRRGAHRRRAQLPNRHKAAIPKSHSSLALYTPNVKPPLYTNPPAHGSVNLQRTRCCCWQLQLQLKLITHNTI